MAKKKSILFFTSFPPPYTGQTIVTQSIYDGLRNQFEIDKLSFSVKNRNVNNGIFSFNHLFTAIRSACRFALKLTNKSYDFVYSVPSSTRIGLLRDTLFSVVHSVLGRKSRLIYHIHSGDFGANFKNLFLSRLFKYNLSKADKIILLSPRLKAFEGYDQKVLYIPNFAETDVILNDEEFKQKVHHDDYFHVVFVSNMIKSKGYEDLLLCAQFLDKERFKFHFIGKWPSEEAKKEAVKFCEDKNLNVEFHGQITSRSKIKEFYKLAGAFCLPTYYPIEAFPLSIVEALSNGIPVISTNHAAIPELVLESHGFIVEKKNPKDLAKKIDKLLVYDTWKEKSVNARKFSVEKLNKQKILLTYFEIFN